MEKSSNELNFEWIVKKGIAGIWQYSWFGKQTKKQQKLAIMIIAY
jgi:hypothetical protein